jgi:hypothetical protein
MGTTNYVNSQKTRLLVLSAVFAGLACLTMYMGVTIVLTGLCVLLMQRKKLFPRLVDMLVSGAIASTPLAVWVTRNYIVSSTLLGNRTPSPYTLLQALNFAFDTAVSWLLPYRRIMETLNINVYTPLKYFAALGLILFTASFTVIAVLNRTNTWKKVNLLDWIQKNRIYILPFTIFVAIYSAYLVVSAASVGFDAINNRLMAPLYTPSVLLLFYILDSIPVLFYRYTKGRIFTRITVMLIAVWLLYPLLSSAILVRDSALNSLGTVSQEQWRESELIAYIRDSLPGGKLYSNFPDKIKAVSGTSAQYLPRKNSLRQYGLERFIDTVMAGEDSAKGDSYIALFSIGGYSGDFYSLNELSAYFIVEEVAKTADGVVYRLR